MSLEKCASYMVFHAEGWNLRDCISESSETWLKECIGPDFDVDNYLAESQAAQRVQADGLMARKAYRMSLAQRCEYSWYARLLKLLPDSARLRLSANSGPTQTWVTALPLSWKNWNLSSREWLVAARRRLGLDVRTK